MVENLWLEIHGVILCSDEFIVFVLFCFVYSGHSFFWNLYSLWNNGVILLEFTF